MIIPIIIPMPVSNEPGPSTSKEYKSGVKIWLSIALLFGIIACVSLIVKVLLYDFALSTEFWNVMLTAVVLAASLLMMISTLGGLGLFITSLFKAMSERKQLNEQEEVS